MVLRLAECKQNSSALPNMKALPSAPHSIYSANVTHGTAVPGIRMTGHRVLCGAAAVASWSRDEAPRIQNARHPTGEEDDGRVVRKQLTGLSLGGGGKAGVPDVLMQLPLALLLLPDHKVLALVYLLAGVAKQGICAQLNGRVFQLFHFPGFEC